MWNLIEENKYEKPTKAKSTWEPSDPSKSILSLSGEAFLETYGPSSHWALIAGCGWLDTQGKKDSENRETPSQVALQTVSTAGPRPPGLLGLLAGGCE